MITYKFIFKWCFVALIGILTNSVQAQIGLTYIKKVVVAEGSNTQSIYDLYVNNKGLLHLGTDKGLVTYNGVFFKSYPFVDNLALSINRIQEDKTGNIWCKNFSNQVFYLERDTLKPYKRVEKFFNDINENLIDFVFFKDELYLLTEQNLYRETADGIISLLSKKSVVRDNILYSLYLENDQIYLASDNKIYQFDGNEITALYDCEPGQKELSVHKNELFYVLKGQNNKLISVKSGTYSKNDIPDKTYYYNLSATGDFLWLNTTNGLFKLDTQNKTITEQLLTNYRVTKIVSDLEGGSWISTLDDGLFYMPNQKMKRLDYKDKNNNTYNFISLAKDDYGHLFAGATSGVIVEFDKNLNPIFEYSGVNSVEIEYIYLYKNQIISTIGVFNKGQQQALLDVYFGKGVAEDDFGNFVFANYNLAGLISQDFKALPNIVGQLKQQPNITFFYDTLQMYVFRNKRSRMVHYSKKFESYYLGFSDGLFKYGLDGSVHEIKSTNNKPIIAVDILETDNGDLWVASAQQGLLVLNEKNVKLHLDKSEGLSDNKSKKLRADQKGIWVTTDSGLDYYDLNTQQLINYGNQLGLSDISINDFAVNETKILFATNQGILFFDKSVLNKTIEPFFEIKAKQSNLKAIEPETALNFSDNQVLFEFNTIYYKSLGDYQYEYKLEPFHQDWQTQNAKQTQLNFLSLKPNKYQLFARIKTGSRYSDVKQFNFKVKQPFYGKLWFQILVFLSLILLLTAVYRWAVLKTKKQQNIKELLAISQLTALRSQMNPHFMFNVLNAVQGLIYSNQKSKANEYLGTFSTLMRKTLDVSDKRDISILQEVETIELYVSLEKARFEENEFEYSIILPDEDLNAYAIPSLIIQPFVENAIKHGLMHKRGKKYLSISVKKENEYYWEFIIKDNGVGRKTATHINQKINKKYKSFATNAIDNRIYLINKLIKHPIKINIEDLINAQNESLGTQVTIHIPVKPIQKTL